MAVDLKIPKNSTVTCRFKISEDTKDILDQYLAAARESNPGVDDDQVFEAVLQHHFSKDRAFKKWLKEQKEKPQIVEQKAAEAPQMDGSGWVEQEPAVL
jgi:hypothetical protein